MATLAVTASFAAIYLAGGRVPNLAEPITVVDAVFIPDGGSFHIEVRDADGRLFAFGASGRLDMAPESHPLYLQRWGSTFPLPYIITKGSSLECKLAQAVHKWSPAAISTVVYGRESLLAADMKLSKRCGVRPNAGAVTG